MINSANRPRGRPYLGRKRLCFFNGQSNNNDATVWDPLLDIWRSQYSFAYHKRNVVSKLVFCQFYKFSSSFLGEHQLNQKSPIRINLSVGKLNIPLLKSEKKRSNPNILPIRKLRRPPAFSLLERCTEKP